MKNNLFIITALFSAALCPGPLLYAGGNPGLDDYFCNEVKKPFFAEAAGEKGRFIPQRKEAQPDSFLMPKPAGTKRVFIVGESVAALLGSGNNLSGKLTRGQKLLKKLLGSAAGPGATIEIINCGMGGYESYRINGVLEEVLKYSPDLVVALSGNNDTMEETCPGLECELRRRKFRLYEKYFGISNTGREARKKAAMKLHESMLLKMAASAKKAGVPIVFCTLPAAVKDMPPRQPAPLESREFAQGYRLFYANRPAEALQKFKLGLAADPIEPFFNFYAAKALEKLGREKEAAVYFSNALNFDSGMSRSGWERNTVIRRAAAAKGACVADLEKLFQNMAPGGLPGFAQFTDGMHWNVTHNKAVWEEIFRAAGRCGIKGFEKFTAGDQKDWTETPAGTALKRLGYAFSWVDEKNLSEAGLAELARIRTERPELLKNSGASREQLEKLLINNVWSAEQIKRLKDLYPFFLAHLAETERRAGNYPGALSLADKALALKPGHPLLRLVRVQALADTGGKAEAEFLALTEERSLGGKAAALAAAYGFVSAAGPAPGPAAGAGKAAAAGGQDSEFASKENSKASKKLTDQAVDKIFAGDYKAAELLSEKALAKNPLNPEALMNLCVLRQKDGRALKALEACKKAASAVYQDPANKISSLEMLSCEASLESFKLLKALKRGPEAAEILNQCLKRAPPAWPGLEAAKAALKEP